MSRHGSSINISPTVIFARSQDSINNEFPSLIYSVRVAFVVLSLESTLSRLLFVIFINSKRWSAMIFSIWERRMEPLICVFDGLAKVPKSKTSRFRSGRNQHDKTWRWSCLTLMEPAPWTTPNGDLSWCMIFSGIVQWSTKIQKHATFYSSKFFCLKWCFCSQVCFLEGSIYETNQKQCTIHIYIIILFKMTFKIKPCFPAPKNMGQFEWPIKCIWYMIYFLNQFDHTE